MEKPQDHDMEKSVLSALLHHPDEIPMALAIDSDPGLMHDDKNRELWRGIIEMQEQDRPVDPTALVSHVTQNGYLDSKSAEDRVSSIIRLQETAGNVEGWMEMLLDLKNRRELIDLCNDAPKMARDMNTSMGEVRRYMTDAMASTQNVERPSRLGEVSLSLIERLDEDDFEGLSGTIKTGMRELDSIFDGVMWDDFIGILSRPGWGKTSLMVQLILGMKILYPDGIIDVFSIEMSAERITYRFVTQISGVPYSIVKKLLAEGEDVGQDTESKIRKALRTFHEWMEEGSIRLYTGSKTPEQVCQMIRANAMKEEEDQTYLGGFIDNFHRFHGIPTLEEKEKAIKLIKDVTIDTDHPIFLLLQLNRKCEIQNRPPKISDAKSVGQIEQDLDRGVLVDRPDERNPHLSEDDLHEKGIQLNQAIIDVAKNRESKPGHFEKYFHGPTMQFLDEKPFGNEGPPAAGRDPMGISSNGESKAEEATAEDVEDLFGQK